MSSGSGGRTLLEELEARDLLELAGRCARACHVTVEQMLSGDRTSPATRARAAFYAALIDQGGWNPHAIGRLVRRHHSTVSYALERYASKPATTSPASGVVPIAAPAPLASCRPTVTTTRASRLRIVVDRS